MTDYILDAHALLWHLSDNPNLGKRAGEIMDSPESSLILPATAFAEACWIAGKGRTKLGSALIVLDEVTSDARITVLPLTLEIIAKTLEMPLGLEMHDRQIIASALWLAEQGRSTAILTKDEAIIESGLVQIVWQ